MEAKLEDQLAGLENDYFFQVFLDVNKEYDLLDRGRCLEILRGYGLGPNLAWLIENYWKQKMIYPKEGKCLGTAFGTRKGVTQGDPASPLF